MALFLALFTSLPIIIAYWTFVSTFSPRTNDKAKYPGRPVEYYLTFKNEDSRKSTEVMKRSQWRRSRRFISMAKLISIEMRLKSSSITMISELSIHDGQLPLPTTIFLP